MKIGDYEIPNTIDELTIGQFDHLNVLEMDQELTSLDRWLKKFTYLGVPEETFDDFSLEELTEVINEFNEGFEMNPEKVTKVTIDGYDYEARESISAKDMSLIEKTWRGDKDKFASESVAILFKRVDLSRNEHYAPAHIKHKVELFRSQPARIAIPYLNDILKVVTQTAENTVNDSEVVE